MNFTHASQTFLTSHMNQHDGNIHVMPNDDYQDHIESSQCWCQPVMIERAVNGTEVFSHNRAKDIKQ
jgi:hypothetical protein